MLFQTDIMYHKRDWKLPSIADKALLVHSNTEETNYCIYEPLGFIQKWVIAKRIYTFLGWRTCWFQKAAKVTWGYRETPSPGIYYLKLVLWLTSDLLQKGKVPEALKSPHHIRDIPGLEAAKHLVSTGRQENRSSSHSLRLNIRGCLCS